MLCKHNYRTPMLVATCVTIGLATGFLSPAFGEDGLDLSGYKLDPVYETDFENPEEHKIVDESKELIKDGERQPLPEGTDWVYEGVDKAWIEDGKLWIGSEDADLKFQEGLKRARYHSVLWNTREFPEDFLLEFTFTQTRKTGLNIVFFAAKAGEEAGGGSIFKPGLPKRRGRFNNYTKGPIDSYHISYFATTPRGNARGHSNMRKNSGFHLVAEGKDFISDIEDPGPHTVRVLKVGPEVTLEVNGKIALEWTDTGEAGGPPHGAGCIGLRQMKHSAICSYDTFKVWEVSEQ